MSNQNHPSVGLRTGRGIAVRGNDIDTDQIIPARYMKVVTFEGLGEYAFHDQRIGQDGSLKDHPFNDPRFQGASILLVNKNFGCGSSREHAPQALARWGIEAVVGESFAEIFAGNCVAMGVPTVTLSESDVAELMDRVESRPETELSLDIRAGVLHADDRDYAVEMPPAYRSALIAGTWDSTSVLLAGLDEIRETAARLPYLAGFRA